jgi:hypothetical protein
VSFSELPILTQVSLATKVCSGPTLQVHGQLQLYFEVATFMTAEIEAESGK